jgi:hypothetical protein
MATTRHRPAVSSLHSGTPRVTGTSERIRDKIGASKRKGLWVGDMVPLGYVSRDKKLFIGLADTRAAF